MQLHEQPFLEIEQESHHLSALAAISLACLLLVIIKGNSLLQYWQQTHHIFMSISSPPKVGELLPGSQQWAQWQAVADKWLDDRNNRMLLAGQLLLVGDKALPEPVIPVVEIPECPAPVAPQIPVCPQPERVADATAEANNNPQPAVVANINYTTPGQAAAEQSIDQTRPNSRLDTEPDPESNTEPGAPLADPSFEADTLEPLPEPTPETLAAANEPIGLRPGDRILLVGDSLMQGVAPHLITALRRNYKVESLDLSRHSTGLTYPAFFDWPATVEAAFELESYQVVIVFLGANDPWDMNLHGKYVRYGSERWREVYSARVHQIIQTAAEHHARLVWLGAPPMGRNDLMGKEPLLNEIYADEAARYPLSARFVATAPSLSEDGNSFTKFMELPDRGSVMIRTDDGVHFTTQGLKLLAKLTLEQFTRASLHLPEPGPAQQPIAEPVEMPTDSKQADPPAPPPNGPNYQPSPNQQPTPAISQR